MAMLRSKPNQNLLVFVAARASDSLSPHTVNHMARFALDANDYTHSPNSASLQNLARLAVDVHNCTGSGETHAGYSCLAAWGESSTSRTFGPHIAPIKVGSETRQPVLALELRIDVTSGTFRMVCFSRIFERLSGSNNPVMKEFLPSQASIPRCRRNAVALKNRGRHHAFASRLDYIRMASRSLTPSDTVGMQGGGPIQAETLQPVRSQMPEADIKLFSKSIDVLGFFDEHERSRRMELSGIYLRLVAAIGA